MTSRFFAPLLCLASLAAQPNPPGLADVTAVVETYCLGCHNGTTKSPGGRLLDQFDVTQIAANREVWSRAYRQLQAGTMPPFGAPRPGRAAVAAALRSLEHALDDSSATKPKPAVGGQELATRLAAFLWNDAPDAPLLRDARSNRLSDPAVLDRQVRRMLADNRAQALVSRFFFPWLKLDQLAKADPDKTHFPDYDVSLRDSFTKETELFLLSQLRENRDPVELWSANYTFLDERLGRHYGVPGVAGTQFRRVTTTPERAGLLGQGSILMATSRHQHGVDAAYTTPATRAVWVRAHFLGVPPPAPFPGAQPVKPELPITPQTRTLPVNPCVTCHQNFFPLGYALENFDPIGRWRTHDQAGPVDASGAFVDGVPTNGVVEMRRVLLQRPEAFRTTITERLVDYWSTGKAAPANGTPETLIRARQVLRALPETRWSALIAAIVRQTPAPE